MKFGVKEMRNELMEKAGEELGKKRKEQEETRDELIGRRKVEKRRKERK